MNRPMEGIAASSRIGPGSCWKGSKAWIEGEGEAASGMGDDEGWMCNAEERIEEKREKRGAYLGGLRT